MECGCGACVQLCFRFVCPEMKIQRAAWRYEMKKGEEQHFRVWSTATQRETECLTALNRQSKILVRIMLLASNKLFNSWLLNLQHLQRVICDDWQIANDFICYQGPAVCVNEIERDYLHCARYIKESCSAHIACSWGLQAVMEFSKYTDSWEEGLLMQILWIQITF